MGAKSGAIEGGIDSNGWLLYRHSCCHVHHSSPHLVLFSSTLFFPFNLY